MDPVYQEVIKVVGGIIASALGMLLIWIATQMARKLGLSVSAEQQAQLQWFAQQAAKKMEEIAAAKLKSTGERMTPAEQMAGAVEAVMENLPRVDASKATSAVTAALPELGIGASGPLSAAKPVVLMAPANPQPAPAP